MTMLMTEPKTHGSRPSDSGSRLAPTLGPLVCTWIERYLVHSNGDYLGQPFRLRSYERRFIWRAYELNADGSRKYSRALLGLPKGNGKTELAAALGCCEFAGPVVFAGWRENGRPSGTRRTAPDIPIAAASFDQANTLFGAARTMIEQGPLANLFECFETRILPKKGAGEMYRVAAVAGTNDGRRPTFFLADELHEWMGTKERVHLVLSNGVAKRADAWELAISTAGWDMTSLLARLYDYGQRLSRGEVEDHRFLFEWHEAAQAWDLDDPEQLRAAILEANPAAGDFLRTENLIGRYHDPEVPTHEFRRYNLNQWVAMPDRWLPEGAWEARADWDRVVPDGTDIVLGFDGSYSRDSTALIGATIEERPHIFSVAAWEKPPGAREDWRVDIPDSEQAIVNACARWRVSAVACDPFRWQRTIAVLAEAGLPMVEWPSHQAARMAPACAQFEDAVFSGGLTHDGDQDLARHMANAVIKIDARGKRITKVHKDAPQRIDRAVAAVIAYDMANRAKPTTNGGWLL